jgi:hypothetical protein
MKKEARGLLNNQGIFANSMSKQKIDVFLMQFTNDYGFQDSQALYGLLS